MTKHRFTLESLSARGHWFAICGESYLFNAEGELARQVRLHPRKAFRIRGERRVFVSHDPRAGF